METLIINKRHELPLRKKLLWDGVTVALWIGWIYLWEPLLEVIYKMLTLDAGADDLWKVILNDISVIPVQNAIWMLIATPMILFVLSRINRHRAPSAHVIYEERDYAGYFKIDNEELKRCVQSQLVTVYHDDHGHIVRLEETIEKTPH